MASVSVTEDPVTSVPTATGRGRGGRGGWEDYSDAPIAQGGDKAAARFTDARRVLAAGNQTGDATAADGAKAEIDALLLFQRDMGAFVRLYACEGIDLSKVKLTHHTLRSRGTAAMSLGVGEKPLLSPVTEAGSGSVQAKEKAYLRAIIEKLNTLFEGNLTDDDQLARGGSKGGSGAREGQVVADERSNPPRWK